MDGGRVYHFFRGGEAGRTSESPPDLRHGVVPRNFHHLYILLNVSTSHGMRWNHWSQRARSGICILDGQLNTIFKSPRFCNTNQWRTSITHFNYDWSKIVGQPLYILENTHHIWKCYLNSSLDKLENCQLLLGPEREMVQWHFSLWTQEWHLPEHAPKLISSYLRC